jgi:hypothetical protein
MGRFWGRDGDIRDVRVVVTDRGRVIATIDARLDLDDAEAVTVWKASQCSRLRLRHPGDVVFDFRDSAGRISIRQEAA